MLPAYSFATIVTEEHDYFYLKYYSNGDFGSPSVNGNTLSFSPKDMSVEHTGKYPSRYHNRQKRGFDYNHIFGYIDAVNTWSTHIGIVPKEGFDIDMLTLTESGSYSYEQNVDDGKGNFSVTTRLIVRDMDSKRKYDYDFFKFNESFTKTDTVESGDWSLSEFVDLADFTDGFWLTLKNTLRVDAKRPYKRYSYNRSYRNGWGSSKHGKKGKDNNRWQSSSDKLYLDKEFVSIEFSGKNAVVPVPAAFWLFLSACGLLTACRKLKA